MKIALISPGVNVYNEQPPLGLLQLATYLEHHGHNVMIINRPCGDRLDMIDEFEPDFIGISGTTQVITDAYECADWCRKVGYWVVMGGIHATAMPNEALKHADTVIVGEGEIAMVEFLNNPIKGIIKGTPLPNLDDIGTPCYKLIDMEYYTMRNEGILAFAPIGSKVGCLLTSRGCPFDCIYCYNSFREAPIRYSSPEYVVENMNYLYDNYGINAIIFLEDNFFANKPRVREICKLLIENKRNFFWAANARVDNIDEETLQLAHRVGMMQVAFGLESGSQRILDILNKKTTVEKAVESIKICDKVGVMVSGSFMFGNPTETLKDIEMTKKFIEDNNIDGPIGFCITLPFPGTKLWDIAKRNNLLPDDIDWSKFDYRKMPIKMCDIPEFELTMALNDMAIRCSQTYLNREDSRIRKRRDFYENSTD